MSSYAWHLQVTLSIGGTCTASQSRVALLIERSLSGSRSGGTRVSLQQQQQQAEGEGFTAGWQTLPGAPAAAEVWEDVTQEGLHRLLLRFGINTAVVDRYVVAQSRQAVEVQDPLRLVAHLEVGGCILGEGIRHGEGHLRLRGTLLCYPHSNGHNTSD